MRERVLVKKHFYPWKIKRKCNRKWKSRASNNTNVLGVSLIFCRFRDFELVQAVSPSTGTVQDFLYLHPSRYLVLLRLSKIKVSTPVISQPILLQLFTQNRHTETPCYKGVRHFAVQLTGTMGAQVAKCFYISEDH